MRRKRTILLKAGLRRLVFEETWKSFLGFKFGKRQRFLVDGNEYQATSLEGLGGALAYVESKGPVDGHPHGSILVGSVTLNAAYTVTSRVTIEVDRGKQEVRVMRDDFWEQP